MKNNNPKYFKWEKIYLATANKSEGYWSLDNGCTSHLCFTEENFTEIDANTEWRCLQLDSENRTTLIQGNGNVTLTFLDGNLTVNLSIPNLPTNLMSVSKITDKDYTVLFRKHDAVINDKSKNRIFKAQRNENLYFIQSASKSINRHENSFYRPKSCEATKQSKWLRF